jgi:hypothetical protein
VTRAVSPSASKSILVLALVLGLSGCASKVLKYTDADALLNHDEYDQAMKVTELNAGDVSPPLLPGQSGEFVRWPGPGPYQPLAVVPRVSATPAPPVDSQSAAATVGKSTDKPIGKSSVKSKGGKKSKKEKSTVAAVPTVDPKIKLPELEDSEGFIGRRPISDPFHIGEKVTLEMSYFGLTAGELSMGVSPMAEVNGRQSYHFMASARSTSIFASFYAVDDWLETFVDFQKMIPFNYALHVKESKQLRETRSYIDWSHLMAYFWDKRVTQEHGVEEWKKEWAVPEYSQNVFSAPFYLRTFKLEPGKKVAFRLAHEGQNIIVTGDVLRREKISTPLGDMNTLVISPHIQIDGVFKPIGDVFLWVTDDDRKFYVRIESKIKIGKIVGLVKSIEKGAP